MAESEQAVTADQRAPRGALTARKRIRRVLAVLLAIILAGLGLSYSGRWVAESRQRATTDRCRRLAARFADDITRAGREGGLLVDTHEFSYRFHYNILAQKCYVMTEGLNDQVFDLAVISSQVWDADAGVGAADIAEQHRMVSEPGAAFISPRALNDGVTVYRGKERLPAGRASMGWFEELMLQQQTDWTRRRWQ